MPQTESVYTANNEEAIDYWQIQAASDYHSAYVRSIADGEIIDWCTHDAVIHYIMNHIREELSIRLPNGHIWRYNSVPNYDYIDFEQNERQSQEKIRKKNFSDLIDSVLDELC